MNSLTAERYRAWKGWSDDEFGDYSADSAWFAKELSMSGFRTLRGRTVLELGLGNGGFAMWAIHQGAAYCGTELDEALVGRAVARGLRAYAATDFPACMGETERFDLIVAWDVLEHVPRKDLLPMLTTLRHHLGAEGVLIARIPSGDSPFARAIQYGDITHEAPLGSAAAEMLARQAGYTRVKIRPACLPIYGGDLRSMMRRLVVRMIELSTRPILVALMRNPRAITTPNMVLSLQP